MRTSLVFIILLFLFSLCLADTEVIVVGQPTVPAPVAAYNFESGAMTTDSSGNANTLTAGTGTPDEDTSEYKEGACSADFENGNSDAYYRADADLSAGFPFKDGTTNRTIAITMWVKVETTGAVKRYYLSKGTEVGTQGMYLYIAGADATAGQTVFGIYTDDGGGGWKDATHTTQLTADASTWYHIGVSYNGTTGAYLIHITDAAGATVGSDVSGTHAGTAQVNDEEFVIGSSDDYDGNFYDGQIDKLRIFSQALTTAQMESQR